ncbi:hypothetical protein CW713_01750 [Methanophagales archaeon]|nr:MAG: hypothetical protein CW713_01750 [Methanophagales archaeon]
MFLLGVEANDALRENRLNDAEHSHKTIIRYLQTQTLSEPEAEPKIAVGYHQLGRIAEERQQFDVAEQWYRKALEIFKRLGFQQGRLHESVAWFAKTYGTASAYRMPVVEVIRSWLGRLFEAMGREGFVNAWREATGGEEPRIDEIKVKG